MTDGQRDILRQQSPSYSYTSHDKNDDNSYDKSNKLRFVALSYATARLIARGDVSVRLLHADIESELITAGSCRFH